MWFAIWCIILTTSPKRGVPGVNFIPTVFLAPKKEYIYQVFIFLVLFNICCLCKWLSGVAILKVKEQVSTLHNILSFTKFYYIYNKIHHCVHNVYNSIVYIYLCNHILRGSESTWREMRNIKLHTSCLGRADTYNAQYETIRFTASGISPINRRKGLNNIKKYIERWLFLNILVQEH